MEPIALISGAVWALDRADVDTDQIMPKQFLKRIERTGYEEFLFYDWVRNGEITVTPAPILVAGRNFGCGSSREHAVWGIHQAGYRAVVAPSFGDIFYGNCTKDGLLPVVLPEPDVRALMAAGSATIDLPAQTVTFAGRTVPFEIDPAIKDRLVNGLDEIALTLHHAGEIAAYESARAVPGPSTTDL
jgi:3-isopropylmalate/(R)-2-methylmalate dehydratase small subunit